MCHDLKGIWGQWLKKGWEPLLYTISLLDVDPKSTS